MNDLQKRYSSLRAEINEFEKLRGKQIAQKEFAENQCQNILNKYNVKSIEELELKYNELKTNYESLLLQVEQYLQDCRKYLNSTGNYNG